MRSSTHAQPKILRVDDLELDLRGCRATLAGREIRLTQTEFRLLEVMMRRPGVAFHRAELMALVRRNAGALNPRAIDVYVARLRERLQLDGTHPSPIHSIRGVGYVLRRSGDPEQHLCPGAHKEVRHPQLHSLIDALGDEDVAMAEHFLRLLSRHYGNGEAR